MIRTRWGYYLTDVDELPPLITVDEFVEMNGDAFDPTDVRLESTLASVSSAVRNVCHWHISPCLACWCETHAQGVAFALPVMGVESVNSVEVGGEEVDESTYEWREDGMVRRVPPESWPRSWRSISVNFKAGYDLDAVPDLAAIVSQIAANNLAAAPGVRREQAGGVSIDYNSNGSGGSGGVSLLDRDLVLLAPYRLPSVPA